MSMIDLKVEFPLHIHKIYGVMDKAVPVKFGQHSITSF